MSGSRLVFVVELKLNNAVLSCITTMKRLLCHSLHRSVILVSILERSSKIDQYNAKMFFAFLLQSDHHH
jgi:hypothetical protein